MRSPEKRKEFLEHGRLDKSRPTVSLVGFSKYLLTGTLIYAISFFLPAIRIEHGDSSDSILGWVCALLTLRIISHGAFEHVNAGGLLMSLIGLINPLLLIYLFLHFFAGSGVARARIVLAIIIAVMIPITAFYMIISKIWIHIGYIFWIAGLGLMAGSGIVQAAVGRPRS